MIPRQVTRLQNNTPSPTATNHTVQTAKSQLESSTILDSGSETAVNTTKEQRCHSTQIVLAEKGFSHDDDDLILKASMSSIEKVDINHTNKSNIEIVNKDDDKNEALTLGIPEISGFGDSNVSLISNRLTQQICTAKATTVTINDSQNLILDCGAIDCLNTKSSNNFNIENNVTVAPYINVTGQSCNKEQMSNSLNSLNSFEKELKVDDSLRLSILNTTVLSNENSHGKKFLCPFVKEVTLIDDDHRNANEDVNKVADSRNRQVLKGDEIEAEIDKNDIPESVLSSKKDHEVFLSSKESLKDPMKQQIPEDKISDASTKHEPLFLLTDPEFSKQSFQEQDDINASYAAILPTEKQEFMTFELTTSQNVTEINMLNSRNDVTDACDLRYNLTTKSVPSFFASACREFQENYSDNFLRGCKWSPDGNCVLTNSNDNCLRVFQPFETINQNESDSMQMASRVKMKESGQIYDFVWHPRMSLWEPEFCRVASTCTGIPIHMWDTTTGSIVANYRAYDQYDEVTAAYSLSFSLDGSKIYAGYNKAIRIFDTEYPVRSCKLVKTFNTQKKDGQTGIISCFTHSPNRDGLYVAGSYSRHIGIYDSACDKLVCLIQGQHGGITHVKFSPDGSKLYSGGRKDAEILCWDIRNMGKILFSALRDVKTNQRIYFDLSQSGRYLVSGNNDGTVAFWDTLSSFEEINGDVFLKPCSQFVAHDDCVNGVSFNCQYDMIATASGQRHFQNFEECDSDDSDQDFMMKEAQAWDFSLKLWKVPLLQEEMTVS